MFFKAYKNKILLASVSIILLVLMAVSAIGKPKAGILSDTFGAVLTPLQSGINYISACFSYGSDRDKYENENTILKQQLITAQKRASDYEELSKENDRLRAMLELKKSSRDYELVAANVVGTDATNWSSTLRLNKGLSLGIKKNDTVITEAGLVGYISNVGRTWAEVTTIIDSSSSVSAVVERIDEYCMLQGDTSLYDKRQCAMKYASTDSAISIGDILSTSGDGGIFPKGIQIGKIKEISVNTNGISQDAVIDPFVDFNELDTVLVITAKAAESEEE